MKAYSMDLRKRVLAMCDAGRTTREVAGVFEVSESWVRRLKQRRREDGSIGPRPAGGRRFGHFDPVRLEQIERWLRKDSDATLEYLLGR
ncbi:MAG: helix-turn-helix domain-containing protein, partial [Planctomycetota bacterium]